jgi:hypothetical protein
MKTYHAREAHPGTVLELVDDSGTVLKDVFLQPGDDESAFWEEYEKADNLEDPDLAEKAKQNIISEYFV